MKAADRLEIIRKANAELDEAITAYNATSKEPGSIADLAGAMGRFEAAVMIAHAKIAHALGRKSRQDLASVTTSAYKGDRALRDVRRSADGTRRCLP